MATEMVMDNKVVAEAPTKVVVMVMVVVAAMDVVVVVTVMVEVFLVVTEMDQTTTLIWNV